MKRYFLSPAEPGIYHKPVYNRSVTIDGTLKCGFIMNDSFDSIEKIRVLFEISTIIQSDTNLVEKFEKALEKVVIAIDCPSASLFINDSDTGKLVEIATVGNSVNLIESINFDMGMGFSAWVAKQRRSVLIPNLRKDREDGLKSFISTPLVSGENLIGVMNLGHDKPDVFTERHMEFLEIIASQLAHTIERADYELMLIEKNEALEAARDEINKQHLTIIEMEKFHVLGQVAASINHEINNPLTTILGNVELLLMLNPDLDKVIRKKLNTINSEAKRIAKIVEKLRDAKKVVVGDYLQKYGETMIDLHSSGESDGEDEEENLS